MKTMTLRIVLFAVAALTFATGAFAAADVVTVGTVTASGTTVDVPVYIRDVAGSPLGIDQPAGSKIDSYSIKVTYAPAAAVQSITFTRAGITAGLTPTFEVSQPASGSISLLDTFQESTSPIPFTLNAPAPGNQVAHLVVTLSSSATPGSSISLTLDTSLTQLTDQGGSPATKETVAAGTLAVVNGAINIPPLSLTLSPSTVSVFAKSSALITASINSAQPSATAVSLVSSAPAIATISSVVTIPAGALSATAAVSGQSAGTATITGSLSTGAMSNLTVNVFAAPPCTPPAAPQISAPATSASGSSYTISWPAVAGANDYFVDEASDIAFTAPGTQSTTTLSASFTHSASTNTTYYYRVRAHARSGNCDVTSIDSNVASVIVNAPVTPPLPPRVIPVVGSVAGNFGSFFRTSVQLYNPQSSAISGRIVFHTQGTPGSGSDPSLAYALGAGKTLAYTDLLPAMGVTSGLGTADLVADLGSSFPVTLVRVFNDGGAAGTTGLTEEAFQIADALQAGDKAVLVPPADASRLRLNIGVRSLDNGAEVTFVIRDANGSIVRTATKSFSPTFFQQTPAAQFLDYTFAGGESISIDVTSGSLFVYGSTTDNTSNDPSVQFARRVNQ
jgi:hypothetical protein